jgi:hypothetical protein
MFDGALSEPHLYYVDARHWPSFRDKVWPALEKMAEKSCGRYLAEDLEQHIIHRRTHLWLFLRRGDIMGSLLTEVIQYPRRRAMRYTCLVGHKSRTWRHLGSEIERVARVCFGCTLMEAMPSKGIDRLLVTDGWNMTHTFHEKEI